MLNKTGGYQPRGKPVVGKNPPKGRGSVMPSASKKAEVEDAYALCILLPLDKKQYKKLEKIYKEKRIVKCAIPDLEFMGKIYNDKNIRGMVVDTTWAKDFGVITIGK